MRVYSAVHCCLRAWAWARARVAGVELCRSHGCR